jgi:hypothetical protein
MRATVTDAEPPAEAHERTTSTSEPLPAEPSQKIELHLEGVVVRESTLQNSPMLPYVRMIVSLVEGIQLSCQQLLQLLRRALRQHRLAHRRKVDYLLGVLHQRPP